MADKQCLPLMTASLMRFLLSEPFCRLLSHLTGLDLADNVIRPNIDEVGGGGEGSSLLVGNETELTLDCIRREGEGSNGSGCGGGEGATRPVRESVGKEKQLFVSERDNEHPAELGSCTSAGVEATQSTAKQRIDCSKHEHDPTTDKHTQNCPAPNSNHHITSPVHPVSNSGHSAHIPNHPTHSMHHAPATTDCTAAKEAVQTTTHTATAGNATNDSTLSATHAVTEAVIGATESATGTTTESAADTVAEATTGAATEAAMDLDAATEVTIDLNAATIDLDAGTGATIDLDAATEAASGTATVAATDAAIEAAAIEAAADTATDAAIEAAAITEAAPTAGAGVGCCARVKGELLCCCPGDYTLISDCDTASGESALDILLHFCCEGMCFCIFCGEGDMKNHIF